jgi:hypothetical protein
LGISHTGLIAKAALRVHNFSMLASGRFIPVVTDHPKQYRFPGVLQCLVSWAAEEEALRWSMVS